MLALAAEGAVDGMRSRHVINSHFPHTKEGFHRILEKITKESPNFSTRHTRQPLLKCRYSIVLAKVS